ncbi:MAG: thiamine-phosphate kinase [Pseudomonadota bacterium]
MDEFQLIEKYFNCNEIHRRDVKLGIGDDAAIVKVPQGFELVTTVDTLVEGIHFLKNTPAEYLAQRILTVNLSDIASMGAKPCWMTLAVTLPKVQTKWLNQFSKVFFKLAKQHQIQLIGGNVSRGPLTFTLNAFGLVPKGTALKRSGAKNRDLVCVTGALGDSALALAGLTKKIKLPRSSQAKLRAQYFAPQAQIAAGLILRHYANACIDISDGLIQDLQHLLDASGKGAKLYLSKIPLSRFIRQILDKQQALGYALNGGEDYQLLFTVAAKKIAALEKKLKFYVIGQIDQTKRLKLVDENEEIIQLNKKGYKHF